MPFSRTFGTEIDFYKGVGPGFDFLRIALALSVVFMHCFFLTGNGAFLRSTPLWFGEFSIVPMFFALSGFLIAGSAKRLRLSNFLIHRAIRIVPALTVDILVCTLIIGPLFTRFSLEQYFSSSLFYEYFFNVIGWIHYLLPGLFDDNPSQLVNDALWTVPWEIFCYAVMSVLMLLSVAKLTKTSIGAAVLLLIAGTVSHYCRPFLPENYRDIVDFMFLSRGSQLVYAFLLGIIFYQIRYYVPKAKLLFTACVACALYTMFFLDDASSGVMRKLVVTPSLVYITVYIGLTKIYLPSFFKRGDYSYGIYLYHDPFLQVLISLFPSLYLNYKMGAVILYVTGLCPVLIVAMMSWHGIEKPILKLRRRLTFVAGGRGLNEVSGSLSRAGSGAVRDAGALR